MTKNYPNTIEQATTLLDGSHGLCKKYPNCDECPYLDEHEVCELIRLGLKINKLYIKLEKDRRKTND